MDLQKLLRAEHSKKQTDRIVEYIGDDKERFAQRHGRVMSICFDFAGDVETPIAVKAFSLTILSNLSKEYPGIRSELKLIIEEQWEQATPAFRSRAGKILKGL